MDDTQNVEVMGIEVEYPKSVLSSPKFMMAIGDVADEDLPDDEKLVVNARMMRMLFGSGRYALMDELESAGIEFSDWLPKFFEAVGAKN